MNEFIEITGAREHNLKNISVKIPKNKLVAISGPSGSGKSSFAIDILQRECQRQYMESMGMVTDGMNKPKVDDIIGLSPSISVKQGKNTKNPRSTVGTTTEIMTYLRVLYAKFGERKCPECNHNIKPVFSESEAVNEGETVSCPNCGAALERLTMASFSFNKAEGFCETCSGLGLVNDLDLSSFIDENLSLEDGAVKMWKGVIAEHYRKVMNNAGKHYGFDCDASKKIKDYSQIERLVFFEGVNSPEFKAQFPDIPAPKRVYDGNVEGLYTYMKKKSAENIRKGTNNQQIAACFKTRVCHDCNGTRLKKSSREVFVDGKSIVEISAMTLSELKHWLTFLERKIDTAGLEVFRVLNNDIAKRLLPVIEIGLSYLSLERQISTLSGGESQRLRLARLMNSGLTGVLYVLDEPTSGLHPVDTGKILESLKRLRDLGNTVLVIEHDMSFVRECDFVIDFGPGAGDKGGQVTAAGTPIELMNDSNSVTGQFLKPQKKESVRQHSDIQKSLTIRGAGLHNLKNLNVSIPLNCIVSVTGVSGSGKSSLILDILGNYPENKEMVEEIDGLETIRKIIEVDQKGLGRSSRSNVATYTDIFSIIRNIFASAPKSRMLKLKSGDFSFNVKGGRCEKCRGLGFIPLDMHFLEDVEVECPVCHGRRFHAKTLSVKYKGYSISDILDLTVEENITVFKEHPDLIRRLNILKDVGLDYLCLGQSTSTLSGGECQRIKISKELGRNEKADNLYLMDEPTAGLHPGDSMKLIKLLKKLVDRGHSVIVIEHSMDFVSQSDWVIDLGPEGGNNGGCIVAEGPPDYIRTVPESHTGRYL